MNVTFNNGQTFAAKTSVEQKIYRDGAPVGWVLSLSLTGNANSETIDALLTEENISKITITSETEEVILTGYDKTTSCVLKYTETSFIAEIQLTKGV